MDANVLLFSLHHPHALFAHIVHDAEDVHILCAARYLLDDAVQCDEGTGSPYSRAAVHHDGPLVGAHTLAEGAHEAHQRLRRVRHPEVWPRREVEVSYGTLGFSLKSTKFTLKFRRPVITRHATNALDKC